MKGNKFFEIILLLIIPVIFMVVLIPKVIEKIEKYREEEFINMAKIVLLGAEKRYLMNNYNNVDSIITCNDVIDLNGNYLDCSIYINNDKINVTLVGKGKFSNMNICSKDKNNLEISSSCNGICFNTNIYDINKPYSIKSYDSCIKNLSDVMINELGYSTSNVLEFCNGNNTLKYIETMKNSLITDEYLIDNNIIEGRVNKVCMPNEFKHFCYTFKIYNEDNKNYAEIIDYDDSCGSGVVVPNKVMGVSVERIGDYAFSQKKVNSISLPDTIKSIGTGAFQGHGDGVNSNIRGVYLSGELDLSHMKKLKTIDSFAFIDNNITKLKLPNSVELINDYSFSGNNISNELDLSNTSLKRVGAYSFSGNNITSINLPESIESIGYISFASNKIKYLDLTKNINLKEIDEEAFANNKIESINLPDSLVQVGNGSFALNEISGILDLSSNKNLKSIGNCAFSNNQIEEIILPESIEKIGDSAFIKNDNSNLNLNKIINSSNKEFDFNLIIKGVSDKTFDFGKIEDVEIIKP